MLSLQRCREILGAKCRLDDQELERLREQLYGLADVVTDHISSNASPAKSSQPSHDFSAALQLLTAEETEDVEERAAIIEFEAGANRDDAEREAIRSALRVRLETKKRD